MSLAVDVGNSHVGGLCVSKRRSFRMRKAVNRTLKGRLLQGKRRPFITRLIIRQLQIKGCTRQQGMQKGVATLIRAATPCIERVVLMLRHYFFNINSITPFLAASPYLSVVLFASLYTFIWSIWSGLMLDMSSTCLPSTT